MLLRKYHELLLELGLNESHLLGIRYHLLRLRLLLSLQSGAVRITDLHYLIDLQLLDTGIPLRDEGLELWQLCIAIDQTLGNKWLNAPNRLESVFSHIPITDLHEDLVRQLLPFIGGNVNKVAL